MIEEIAMKEFEIWSDSFREGRFFAELLQNNFQIINIEYKYNFLPIYYFTNKSKEFQFKVVVFGDYTSWDPIPEKVETLLEMGKPDMIMYDPLSDNILLAIEETAAVPTGNQGLQRLERVWHASELGIPFVYIMGQYGLHIDGGIRTNSIWPGYLGLKLSLQYCIPSLNLQYGSITNPEDISYGEGFDLLSKFIAVYVYQFLGSPVNKQSFKDLLKIIYKTMGEFINQQADKITTYLPARELLTKDEFLEILTDRIKYE